MFRRAAIAAILSALALPAGAHPLDGRPYEARVLSVYDGDTFTADVAVWPGVTARAHIRVAGVDTPEIRGRCPREKRLARAARDRARALLGKAAIVENVRRGKYAGRVVARVTLAEGPRKGETLASVLIDEGLGRAYDGGRRAGWCGD